MFLESIKKMSVLQNRSCHILKHARFFNNARVTRLMSKKATSSAEIIQREKKVSAFNYDPLSVVIAKGQGKTITFKWNDISFLFSSQLIINATKKTINEQAYACGTWKARSISIFWAALPLSTRDTVIRKSSKPWSIRYRHSIILPEPYITTVCTNSTNFSLKHSDSIRCSTWTLVMWTRGHLFMKNIYICIYNCD